MTSNSATNRPKPLPMGKRYNYVPLTPDEFSRGLNEVGLTMRDFCRVSGSDVRRVERWLRGEETPPPMWVGSLLVALTIPDAHRRVEAYVEAVVRYAPDPETDREETGYTERV